MTNTNTEPIRDWRVDCNSFYAKSEYFLARHKSTSVSYLTENTTNKASWEAVLCSKVHNEVIAS